MLSRQQLLDSYEKMVSIRLFDREAMRLKLSGEIVGNVHVYIGEEAIAAGVCAALRKDDYIESTHRGHGHTIAKGGDMRFMMAELYGRATGYCRGKGGSQHIADFSIGMLGANGMVGGGFALAVGAAMGARFQGRDNVAVVFFGDGASNRGTFHESANMAAAWKLPVIFVCENNGWAAGTKFDGRQISVEDIAIRATAYDIPGRVVNGNDFFAVYEAAQALVDRARRGEGNACALLECKTRRIEGHHVGDSQDYRTGENPRAYLEANDPIAAFERRVLAEGWLNREELDRVRERARQRLAEAKDFAIRSPFPEAAELTTDLYD